MNEYILDSTLFEHSPVSNKVCFSGTHCDENHNVYETKTFFSLKSFTPFQQYVKPIHHDLTIHDAAPFLVQTDVFTLPCSDVPDKVLSKMQRENKENSKQGVKTFVNR